MAIRLPQPIQVSGQTFDLLSVSLALSTVSRGDRMVLSIAVTFTPYRDTPNGPQLLEGVVIPPIIYGDVQEAIDLGDLAVAQFYAALEAAGQAFINSRA